MRTLYRKSNPVSEHCLPYFFRKTECFKDNFQAIPERNCRNCHAISDNCLPYFLDGGTTITVIVTQCKESVLYCWLYCTVDCIALLTVLYCWLYCTVDCTVLLTTLYCWLYCTVDCTVLLTVLLTALYCWLYCTVDCIVLFTALHCLLYCTVYCIALFTVLYCLLHCTVYCIELLTVLYSLLYCTVYWQTQRSQKARKQRGDCGSPVSWRWCRCWWRCCGRACRWSCRGRGWRWCWTTVPALSVWAETGRWGSWRWRWRVSDHLQRKVNFSRSPCVVGSHWPWQVALRTWTLPVARVWWGHTDFDR